MREINKKKEKIGLEQKQFGVDEIALLSFNCCKVGSHCMKQNIFDNQNGVLDFDTKHVLDDSLDLAHAESYMADRRNAVVSPNGEQRMST